MPQDVVAVIVKRLGKWSSGPRTLLGCARGRCTCERLVRSDGRDGSTRCGSVREAGAMPSQEVEEVSTCCFRGP